MIEMLGTYIYPKFVLVSLKRAEVVAHVETRIESTGQMQVYRWFHLRNIFFISKTNSMEC